MKEAIHGRINDFLMKESVNRNILNLHIPPSKVVNNIYAVFEEIPQVYKDNDDGYVSIHASINIKNSPFIEQNQQTSHRNIRFKKIEQKKSRKSKKIKKLRKLKEII